MKFSIYENMVERMYVCNFRHCVCIELSNIPGQSRATRINARVLLKRASEQRKYNSVLLSQATECPAETRDSRGGQSGEELVESFAVMVMFHKNLNSLFSGNASKFCLGRPAKLSAKVNVKPDKTKSFCSLRRTAGKTTLCKLRF